MSGIVNSAGSRSGVIGSTEIPGGYEEGVHVATITPSTSGTVTMEGNYERLSYTKIGRQVTVTGQLIVSGVSSPVGYFKISLPFVIGSSTNGGELRGCGSLTLADVASADSGGFVSRTNESTSYLMVYLGDGTTYQSDSAEQLAANAVVYLTFTYFTT